MDQAAEPRVYLLRLDAARLELLGLYGGLEVFSQPVRQFEHPRYRACVVFVTDPHNQVIRVTVGKRGSAAGTGLVQLEITHSTLVRPFPFGLSGEHAPSRHRARVAQALRSGEEMLSQGASAEILTMLAEARPEIASVIAAARAINGAAFHEAEEKTAVRQQQEADALFTALNIARIDRPTELRPPPEKLRSDLWIADQVLQLAAKGEPNTPPGVQPKSQDSAQLLLSERIFQADASTRMSEDKMLQNDIQRFPGFEQDLPERKGFYHFRHGDTRLTIYFAHREKLETLLGTDLVYYNENFGSFVMVQYKVMEPDASGDHVFRFPNEKLQAQMAKMQAWQAKLDLLPSPAADPNAFRLHSDAFFVKFCPRSIPHLEGGDLIPGFYFPLAHWTGLAEDEKLLAGPNGGRLLRHRSTSPHSNAPRWLSNSDFAVLVRNAWVGTKPAASEHIIELMQESFGDQRSVTLAVEKRG